MGQKGHIMVQKGLKVYKKKAKNRVFGPKKKVFFLSGIGGYPPPLNGKSGRKKKGFSAKTFLNVSLILTTNFPRVASVCL